MLFSKTVFGECAEDFDEILRHPKRDDPFWNTRFGGGEAHDAIKHANIPIFIPHMGCPNQCVFCNQRAISGRQSFCMDAVAEQIESVIESERLKSYNIENLDEILDNVKSALVDIEVDVPLLEVGGTCLPYFCFGVKPLDFSPNGFTHTLALNTMLHIQEIQMVVSGL